MKIRAQILLLAALLVTACNRGPVSPVSLPDPSLIDNSEPVRVQEMRDASAHLLTLKDYDGLEKLWATDRAMESFLGSGRAPIGSFYEGVCGLPVTDTPAGPAKLEALTEWGKARPDSIAARIALARALVKDAWNARSGDTADKVTPSGWSTFADKLQQAGAVLKSVEAERKSDPEWYVAMNSVGQGLSEGKDSYLSRNLEGSTLYPKSIEIYGGPLIYLLPRWYGSYPEVADYANRSADAVGGDAGDMLYARLAYKVWDYSDDMNVFSQVGFSWPRVRHGMELIINQYPHSQLMANAFCLFAWQAGDQPTAHAVFGYLGDRYIELPWASLQDFQTAQAWALQGEGQTGG